MLFFVAANITSRESTTMACLPNSPGLRRTGRGWSTGWQSPARVR